MFFSFVSGCVKWWTGRGRKASLTEIHAKYSSLVNEFTVDHFNIHGKPEELHNLMLRIQELNRNVMSIIEDVWRNGLQTLKFYHSGHIVTDLEQLGGLEMLDALSSERCNVHIKKELRKQSCRSMNRLDDTVTRISCGIAEHCGRHMMNINVQKLSPMEKRLLLGTPLVSDKTKGTLADME